LIARKLGNDLNFYKEMGTQTKENASK